MTAGGELVDVERALVSVGLVEREHEVEIKNVSARLATQHEYARGIIARGRGGGGGGGGRRLVLAWLGHVQTPNDPVCCAAECRRRC